MTAVEELDWNSETDEEVQDSNSLWMTEALREEMRRKSNMFWNAKRCASAESWESFRLQRKRVSFLVKEAKIKVGLPVKRSSKWTEPLQGQRKAEIPVSQKPDASEGAMTSGSSLCLRCCQKFPYEELVSHFSQQHIHESLKPYVLGKKEKGRKSNASAEFRRAVEILFEKKEFVVGLDFITEYAIDQYSPFFICDLCHHVLQGAQSLFAHVTDTKHQCNYWKSLSIEDYVAFRTKGLKGSQFDAELQTNIQRLQKKLGCGLMFVQKGTSSTPASSLPGFDENMRSGGTPLQKSLDDGANINDVPKRPCVENYFDVPRSSLVGNYNDGPKRPFLENYCGVPRRLLENYNDGTKRPLLKNFNDSVKRPFLENYNDGLKRSLLENYDEPKRPPLLENDVGPKRPLLENFLDGPNRSLIENKDPEFNRWNSLKPSEEQLQEFLRNVSNQLHSFQIEKGQPHFTQKTSEPNHTSSDVKAYSNPDGPDTLLKSNDTPNQFKFAKNAHHSPTPMSRIEKLKRIEDMLDFKISTEAEASVAKKLVRALKVGLLHYKIQTLPDDLVRSLFGEVELNLATSTNSQ